MREIMGGITGAPGWVGLAVGALFTTVVVFRLARLTAKYEHRPLLGRWPIPTVLPQQLDPVFEPTELGPQLSTAVTFVAGLNVPGGVSDRETWILAVLAKSARAIFEFGTCTGKTTYILAANSPADASVVTLTLAPGQAEGYQGSHGDDQHAKRAAVRESRFSRYYYADTPCADKITQLFGDSKLFDDSTHRERYDLIFIDGAHAYSYVISDTAKGLRMLKPGGIVLWHDYRGHGRPRDVYRALNDTSKQIELVHVQGTSLVAWRKLPGN